MRIYNFTESGVVLWGYRGRPHLRSSDRFSLYTMIPQFSLEMIIVFHYIPSGLPMTCNRTSGFTSNNEYYVSLLETL